MLGDVSSLKASIPQISFFLLDSAANLFGISDFELRTGEAAFFEVYNSHEKQFRNSRSETRNSQSEIRHVSIPKHSIPDRFHAPRAGGAEVCGRVCSQRWRQ